MNELPISYEPWVQRTGRNTIFVGILPPREVAGDLSDLSLSFREDRFLRGNPRPTSHLHLTLFHVGNFPWMPADVIATAQRACGAVAERSRSFPLQMDQATCMGKDEGNVPFVLESQRKNADLLLLYQRLFIQMALEGIRSSRKKFEPHITMAYVEKYFRPALVEPIAWMVEDIVLVHSLSGQTQYTELGRWKLEA